MGANYGDTNLAPRNRNQIKDQHRAVGRPPLVTLPCTSLKWLRQNVLCCPLNLIFAHGVFDSLATRKAGGTQCAHCRASLKATASRAGHEAHMGRPPKWAFKHNYLLETCTFPENQ